jgi:hypothetical protein
VLTARPSQEKDARFYKTKRISTTECKVGCEQSAQKTSKLQIKMSAPTYTVQWNYRANSGRKARRYGPYMLQAEIVRSFSNARGEVRKDVTQLGVVSIECITEVSHRHAFWVITEAALESLGLDSRTQERVSAELSTVVPLPSEGEIAECKDTLDSLSRVLRKR